MCQKRHIFCYIIVYIFIFRGLKTENLKKKIMWVLQSDLES